MKRRELVRHLEAHGCQLQREGGEDSHLATGQMQAVPRHSEVADILCRKICRRLSVPDPKRS